MSFDDLHTRLSDPGYVQHLAQLIADPDVDVAGEDAELPITRRKRRPTVDVVIRQLKRAGVEVAGIKTNLDGTFTVLTGKPAAPDLPEDAAPIDRSEWH